MQPASMIPSSERSALEPGTSSGLVSTGSSSTFPSNIWWSLTRLNLLKYFISADEDLPPSYVKKCKKFLEEIKQKNKAASSQAGGPAHKESGFKQQG